MGKPLGAVFWAMLLIVYAAITLFALWALFVE
jgi:hypothetical protein